MDTPEKLKELQFQFAQAIRNPGSTDASLGIEPRRMRVYQELFYNNFYDFVSAAFPVAQTLFTEEAWADLIRRFMIEHRCHSPFFSEIPLEFIDFVQSRAAEILTDKPFLLELLHYEWLEVAVWMADEAHSPNQAVEHWADWRPVLSSVAQVVAYQFPVHQISPEFQPTTPPETPTCLVVYRWHDDVHFMALTPATYGVLCAMDGKTRYADLLTPIAQQMGTDVETLKDMAEPVIRSMCDRQIILGDYPSA